MLTDSKNWSSYYLYKIRKHGVDSLTKKEKQIFDEAKNGKTPFDKPVYQRNKLTGDIEIDEKGNPVKVDFSGVIIPGVPFLTSKGKGVEKKSIINARCYWNNIDKVKYYYVYGGPVSDTNSNGLIIWKTESKSGNPLGAFIIPKSEATMNPVALWKNLNNKFDKGIILDQDTHDKFLEFYNLYKSSRKDNISKLMDLFNYLKNYP